MTGLGMGHGLSLSGVKMAGKKIVTRNYRDFSQVPRYSYIDQKSRNLIDFQEDSMYVESSQRGVDSFVGR